MAAYVFVIILGFIYLTVALAANFKTHIADLCVCK